MAAHRPDTVRRRPLAPELRSYIDEHQLTRKPSFRSAVRIPLVVATYAALFIAAREVGQWWFWGVVWILQAIILAGVYSLMHEATHHSLFRSSWANRLAATGSAGALGVNAPQYRAFHMHHHAFTRQENLTGDPIEFRTPAGYVVGGVMMAGLGGFALPVVVGSLASLFGIHPYYVRNSGQKRDIKRAAWLHLAFVAAIAVWFVMDPSTVASLWVAPLALFYCLVFGFVSEPEHYGLFPDEDVLQTTRTMRANPLFRFFYWNNNFHVEHHLAPNVPYTGLPKLHEALADQPVRIVGYWRFHLGVIRDLSRERKAVPEGEQVSPALRLQRGW